MASDQPAMSFKKQVKRLLLAMSNGSGVGNWLQNASSEGLKDSQLHMESGDPEVPRRREQPPSRLAALQVPEQVVP